MKLTRKMQDPYRKYEDAVSLYATTDLSSKQIAEACHVSVGGFRAYLRRHHRELVLARYGCAPKEGEDPASIRIVPRKGQSAKAHQKYKEAIAACDHADYITYNITQIANMFNLSGTGLANQLRLHYPEILERREATRRRLGLADKYQRGVQPWCVEQYAEALEMCRTTQKSLPCIASECHVSLAGLSQYLRFYHKELIGRREEEREEAKGTHCRGALAGNGRVCRPTEKTVQKYSKALELYRSTSLTVREIVAAAGVTLEGFNNYLRQWHRDLMLERRGAGVAYDKETDLRAVKRFRKSTAAKYAPAIASLKQSLRPVARVAAEFGLNADIFRLYLYEHEPEIAAALGRKRPKASEKKNDTSILTNKESV